MTRLRDLIGDVADAYERMPDARDPRTLAVWRALGDDVRADAWSLVHDHLTTYRVTDDAEPYAAAELMHADLDRGRFRVSRANSEHPVWSPGTNVAFRTAHDVRGHWHARSGFDWPGELAACASHGIWVQPDARRALFVECVMQTGTTIARGAFPTQKVNAFPERYASPALAAAIGRWLNDPRDY